MYYNIKEKKEKKNQQEKFDLITFLNIKVKKMINLKKKKMIFRKLLFLALRKIIHFYY
jgi:hypothetical protein